MEGRRRGPLIERNPVTSVSATASEWLDMGAMRRGSIGRALAVALVAASTLTASPVPAVRPQVVVAAEPGSAKCQTGFLEKAQPQNADCPAADERSAVLPAAVVPGFQESVVWSGLTNPVVAPFRGRWPRVHRREERRHQGLRQPQRPDADGIRQRLVATCRTSGTAGCSAWRSIRASPAAPDRLLRVRAVRLRPHPREWVEPAAVG